MPGAGAATPTCAGKPATIVSDAARIVGTKAPDVIVAGPGANRIHGMGGNDTVCGGDGGDTIYGGRGNDTLRGGAGDDLIFGDRGSDVIDGGEGPDRLFGEFGNDSVDGGPGDGDRVDGGPGDDSLAGGDGDFDTLLGDAGSDRIDGGAGGHDVASYETAVAAVAVDLAVGSVSGAEQEQLSGIEDVLGGAGADVMAGSHATPNRLDGGAGDDRLLGVGPGDEAFGGPGSDECSGPLASEVSCGPAARFSGTAIELHRTIVGSSTLTVTGSDRADELRISYSNGSYLVQGAGTGRVRLGDPGSNGCDRDAADNSVSCHGRVSSITASLGGGDDSFAIGGGLPARVSVTVDGGKGSDALSGGPAGDTLYGGDDGDADTLRGQGGDDVLFGVNIAHPRRSSGAATMRGGGGSDLLVGGQPCEGDLFDGGRGGDDSASFARVRNPGVHVVATIGGTVRDPGLGRCTPGRIGRSVEKIEGSPGPDVLRGDNGPNTLLGRGGNDVLDGRGGFDRCIGARGRNRLIACEARTWRAPIPR